VSSIEPTPPVPDAALRWIGPRGRRILHTGAWSMIAKTAAAANVFLTVPFVLHALGTAQFGAWATLVSLVTFAGFLDFGFGNGTMNLVAAAHGRGASDEVASILNEGRRTLFRVALWLAAAAAVALPLAPWHRLLGMPGAMAAVSRVSAAAVLFAIVLAVPLNLANRVQLGVGRGDRAFRWQAVGQVLTMAVVIGLAKAHASLPVLTAAAVATPLLSSIGNTLQLSRDPEMATPTTLSRNPEIAAHIRREGILFFVLQLAAALSFSADLPLISALRGPTEAGTYAIVQRLFWIVPMGLSLIWMPLWPIYRQALAAGQHAWVVRTLRRSLLLAVLGACAAAIVLALGFDRIIGFWVHRPLAVSGILLAGFAVWCPIEAAGTAIATFLNAASVMRYQVIVASVFAVLCVGAKSWVIVNLGVWSIPWAAAIIYAVANLIPTLLFSRRLVASALARAY
jgi:O-antigen/teichoic acid export membrane protein